MFDSTTKNICFWQKELQLGIHSLPKLLEHLSLDILNPPYSLPLENLTIFPQKIPLDFVKRIKIKDWLDPLLLQVIPQKEESNFKKTFKKDAVSDQDFEIFSGVIHKYPNRILIMPTTNCAIHCRYCFRKHFPYEKIHPLLQNEKFWTYLKSNTQIEEVILSGGDPLMLSDHILFKWFKKINSISHIKHIRIHTRLPIVLPSRILKSNLLEKLTTYSNKIIFVIHCNHPQELEGDCTLALQEIKKKYFILNQAVLLKGINDCPKILKKLQLKLFNFGVLPYYLHQLDQVYGTHHFEVPIHTGKKIYQELLKNISGYLVPKYVKDESPFEYKNPL